MSTATTATPPLPDGNYVIAGEQSGQGLQVDAITDLGSSLAPVVYPLDDTPESETWSITCTFAGSETDPARYRIYASSGGVALASQNLVWVQAGESDSPADSPISADPQPTFFGGGGCHIEEWVLRPTNTSNTFNITSADATSGWAVNAQSNAVQVQVGGSPMPFVFTAI